MSARHVLISAILMTFLSCTGADAEDWPQFRGPRRDGISRETGVYRSWPSTGPKVLWSMRMLGPGFSGPAVYGNSVYINDYDQERSVWMVRCLSLHDGSELWRYEIQKKIRPNHLITRTVPAVDGKYVFSMDPKCGFHCIDAETGKLLWRKELPLEYGTRIPPWYTGQCPLTEEDRVVIAPAGPKALVVALEKATGKELWRTPNTGRWLMSHSSLMPATLCGVKQYIYCTLKGLQGIRAEDGKLLWYFPFKFNVAVAPSPLPLPGDRVFMTSLYNADSVMFKVERQGDQWVARELFRMPPTKWNSEVHTPIYYYGYMYGVGKRFRGLFTCLDLQGNIVWTSYGKAYFGLGSYLLADGLFFALEGDTGVLRLIEATGEGYHELAAAKVLTGPEVWAPMALSKGRLLLRDAHKLVCLEVGKPQAEGATQ